ncbi:hypothetical protein C0M66_005002 [Escherichia coli]|nr:hypothetical protein [Escherichia coli]
MKTKLLATIAMAFCGASIAAGNPETITHEVVGTTDVTLRWEDGGKTSAGKKDTDEPWGKLHIVTNGGFDAVGNYYISSPDGNTRYSNANMTFTVKSGNNTADLYFGKGGDGACFDGGNSDQGKLNSANLGKPDCSWLNVSAIGNGQTIEPGIYTGQILIEKVTQ